MEVTDRLELLRTPGRLQSFTCHVPVLLLPILAPPTMTIRKRAVSVNSSLSGSILDILGYRCFLRFLDMLTCSS